MSVAERRAELDRRLTAALDRSDRTGVTLARAEVQAATDRWCGQLVALSHNTAAGMAHADVVFPAATAFELLRGYCRLRSQLFVQLDNDITHSLTQDPTDALLAGDYLNSAGYAALGSVDHPRLADAFEIVIDVSDSLVQAFDGRHAQSVEDHASFIDETAGALGEGAAVVGATFAGIDNARREDFAALGRGFSAARQIHHVLQSNDGMFRITSPELDERALRQHGARRLSEAQQALDALASTTDVDSLRAFVEEALPEFDSV